MNIHSSICVCVCVCVITISDENIKKMEEIVEPQNLQPMSVYMQSQQDRGRCLKG
jgi:hypothetical protein